MPPRPAVFVRAVMGQLGLRKPSELARTLNMSGYDSPRTVRRWLQGLNAPEFDYAMAMLEKAGWLTDDALEHLQKAEEEARAAERAARRLAEEEPAPSERQSD